MDILFNGDFCLFLFWLLGSTTDFTPQCKFDPALALQGEITFYSSIVCMISPQIYRGCSHWSLQTLYSNRSAHLARSLGSGPLLFMTPLSSLSHCSRNSQYIFIFCYDLISTDPTLPTVFFGGRKDHGKEG
ncbi:hypothetical protein EDB92DRAFT_1835850 [Lactarius akahatsu]|uniref:Secreted protein n=1 Tax=Lactarius akahatsu TaxID=416441 RepID=A0AAD4LNL2_9AGAM|nr:hypothetical protein EDB92DRAFT_1835850 [Lactarius akahatsu]